MCSIPVWDSIIPVEYIPMAWLVHTALHQRASQHECVFVIHLYASWLSLRKYYSFLLLVPMQKHWKESFIFDSSETPRISTNLFFTRFCGGLYWEKFHKIVSKPFPYQALRFLFLVLKPQYSKKALIVSPNFSLRRFKISYLALNSISKFFFKTIQNFVLGTFSICGH